jgi:hypothetical protein
MTGERLTVESAGDLASAAQTPDALVEVAGVRSGLAPLTLAPGVQLRGGVLEFAAQASL